MALLAKLRGLSTREWQDLLVAQVALLQAQWQLRSRPVGALVRREPETEVDSVGRAQRAHELGLAINRVAEHGVFRPRCLARSIALRDLLVRNGFAGSVIRIGVHLESGRFLAHAWVVWSGQVVGDRADWVARFTEVDDLRVLRDS